MLFEKNKIINYKEVNYIYVSFVCRTRRKSVVGLAMRLEVGIVFWTVLLAQKCH